jgi:hypothetical protein
MTYDRSLINEFIRNFYGFGNLQAGFWFIGMEEGGGNSEGEFNKRIQAWQTLGKKSLVDVVKYHEIIGINRFFVEPVKLQSTWNKLIRIYLSANDLPCETEDVRLFQKNHLGRTGQDTALLELLPLASPSTNEWFYDKWADHPLLRTREKYRLGLTPIRINTLRGLIEESTPPIVVFYGQTNEEYWSKVIQLQLKDEGMLDFKYTRSKNTLFISIKHPVYKGLTNE